MDPNTMIAFQQLPQLGSSALQTAQPILQVNPIVATAYKQFPQMDPNMTGAFWRFPQINSNTLQAIQHIPQINPTVAEACKRLSQIKPNNTEIFRRLSQMKPKFIEAFRSGFLPSFSGYNNAHYLQQFRQSYPDFQYWLNSKVFSDVLKNPSQRDVIFILTPDLKSAAGFAVLKNMPSEKKICSFYIAPAYQHSGYGSLLMEECFRYLGTNTPLITMSEKCKELFVPLLQKYNFQYVHELPNYYVPGLTEYVFNGTLYRN